MGGTQEVDILGPAGRVALRTFTGRPGGPKLYKMVAENGPKNGLLHPADRRMKKVR
jgi:hypothetical protein